MATIATLTKVGRSAIAAAIAAKPIHMAWGSGLPEWDNMAEGDLPGLIERETLFNEIGRRSLSIKGFCLPDDEGDIVVPVSVMPDGSVEVARYRRSEEPTPYLYLKVSYDFGDANDAIVRELGVIMDCEVYDEAPEGQMYFRPEEIKVPGRLMAMQILKPEIKRSHAVKQTIEFVLPL